MLPKKKKAASKKRAPRKRVEQPAAQEFSVSGVELRDYQANVLTRLDAGILRQMLIWHRRAGKDISMLEIARIKMQERVGVYWHMFPKHVQAKRALWTGIDARDGKRFIQRAFEPAGVVAANQVDMLIELECGSTWQLLGSDNYDRAIGANVCGVVFSEWALCDPRAWEFIRPILAENGGWAIFISTYRGRNHCYQMAQHNKGRPGWHVEELTVEHTKRSDGSPVITPEQIQAERDGGMPEALIQQEFYCNPDAAITGAIYGPLIARMRAEGRA